MIRSETLRGAESAPRGSELKKGLLVDAAAYLAAFGLGLIPFMLVDNMLAAGAALTLTATAVLYIVSVIFADVSVYDPYWSVAPPVITIAVMLKYRLWNINAAVVLALVLLWSLRLTANWLVTYKGLGHEDWRYAMYRSKCKPLVFQAISFFGFHFVPTIVAYAGLISGLLAICEPRFAPLSLVGVIVMLCAVALEYVSDRAIHGFLAEHSGERRTCNISVWRYSRHPNYLGEMSFWLGMYLYFVAACPRKLFVGLGFLSITVLFLTVSIPMMEKHNSERRADYAEYRAATPMLIPGTRLPRR